MRVDLNIKITIVIKNYIYEIKMSDSTIHLYGDIGDMGHNN